MHERLTNRLALFDLHAELQPHVLAVVRSMPSTIAEDLLDDPSFLMCDYEPVPGRAHMVAVGLPRGRNPARAVVLKRTMLRRPESFVRWVIAHELAHAHLRNAGRFPGDDPEHAADALAAEWGFPKPARFPWS